MMNASPQCSDKAVRAILVSLIAGCVWLAAAPARAQSLLAPDKSEYASGEAGTLNVVIPVALTADRIRWTVARPADPDSGGSPLPIKLEVFHRSESAQYGRAQFAAPSEPGEYEVRILDGGRIAMRSMRFQVTEASPGPAPTPPSTGSPPRADSIEGIWDITWDSYPETGKKTTAKAQLSRAWEQICVEVKGESPIPGRGERQGCRYENRLAQGDNPLRLKYTIDLHNWGSVSPQVGSDGRLTVQWSYRTLGGSRARSELQQVSEDELRGKWSNNENGGSEVWQRIRPVVERVVFKSAIESETTRGGAPGRVGGAWGGAPGRVEGEYSDLLGQPDVDLRGNRRVFKVEIHGKNLWGSHQIDVGEAVDLEPFPGWRQVILTDGKMSGGANNPTTVGGIEQTVVIGPRFQPGRYELRVAGYRIPFDFVVHGYPGSSASGEEESPAALRFARKSGERFEPATSFHQDEKFFFIEAEFEQKDGVPGPSERTVQLERTEGGKPPETIVVHLKPKEAIVVAGKKRDLYRSDPQPIRKE